MIGLVVATHAGLARELIASTTMITGEIPLCEAVGLHPDDPPDGLLQRIGEALDRVGGDGAVIMTDMFGGTPSNTALSFLAEGKVEVVTGVNLPMLVEFCSRRERQSLEELTASLLKSGRESILSAGEFLKR
ncbi:PTS sugar transporter subunit IIA [Trichlorobacter ammonificans]|uniref:PTS system fructose subfamily IIA component n=1 Tax=Trichlorobacter ammonificans TaxID=2916410 RepID=A0ABN8HFK3_9BACT|nr:PTS sugar transporter subunit IIA [Trichlorobacter ammonificans]CAH2030697.1 PTS system fructose subfamily IIA component [Trichlorobacter ammonificans]